MKKPFVRIIVSLIVLLLSGQHVFEPSMAHGQLDTTLGVQPLIKPENQSIHDFIPDHVQPLIRPQEIEQFLRHLEQTPPDWTQLRHDNITRQSEQLFEFNRQRDTARLNNAAGLTQPVAFLWTGMLREFLPEFQGFTLALGPELTPTSWGIVRFKPRDLPDYIVAVPSPELRETLLTRRQKGEQIEVLVIAIGTLVSEESLIYGFSHDGHQEGMILPVVTLQKVLYLLNSE